MNGMRKLLFGLIASLLMILTLSGAMAAEAMDITAECTFRCSYTGNPSKNINDGKYTTKAKLRKVKNPWVSVSSPAGLDIHGIYMCFASMPESYEIQVDYGEGNGWEKYVDGDTRFYHVYVPLNGVKNVRIYCTQETKYEWSFNEIFVLSEGDLPDWVQCWEPTKEKADIMFLVAHPDDELIFMAGALPTYAVEQQRDVVIAYLSYSNTTRRSELLNGLWAMGIRNYPVIGEFRDAYSKKLATAYDKLGGKAKVRNFVVELYRKYKPEVVVTHDLNGEYGHGQHQVVADTAAAAIELAASEGEYLDSYMEYGAWSVKKLYHHLYPENQITFDWNVPLQSMGGKTGLELAVAAYDLHVTQKGSGMSVTETGTEYDNRVFGLAYTAVGPDVRGDDFLENVYESPASYVPVTPTPAPTPAPTPVPAYVAVMPQLNAKGFLDEGEFVYSSEEQGLWIFVDETTKVIINRRYDSAQPLTWFEAEIWTDVEAGTLINNYPYDREKMGAVRANAQKTAALNQLAFAMNADYYTYRVRSTNGRHTGVVIRDGKILYDDPVPEKKVTSGLFPNLDMLAFFPDGSLETYHSYEITAQELVDKGAYTVLSFGPYLIKDGEFSERVFTSNDAKNPRAAFGMVEPGHYVAIMAEGRLKRSEGVTIKHLAQLMRAKNCQVAFNLDGGQTAVMVFMGTQLNKIGSYDGGKTYARSTSEVMGVGFSEQVGVYEVDVDNK
ncbi:MAG: phosphodiester glycosidase family protein [Clostridia bacterium]|nr:phosphodiester glycosidase family protein [Clostridia bacterium]